MESVIGSEVQPVLERFHTALPTKFGVGKGPVRVNGVLITVDAHTGRATAIERVARTWHE
jgi:calcineurin-like phosphoesterase